MAVILCSASLFFFGSIPKIYSLQEKKCKKKKIEAHLKYIPKIREDLILYLLRDDIQITRKIILNGTIKLIDSNLF